MVLNADERINALRKRICTNEEIAGDNGDALIDFSDRLFLLLADYSDHRHEKPFRHCTRMAEEVGGLADALNGRSTTQDIVRWINRTYNNEETNRDYRIALRLSRVKVRLRVQQ